MKLAVVFRNLTAFSLVALGCFFVLQLRIVINAGFWSLVPNKLIPAVICFAVASLFLWRDIRFSAIASVSRVVLGAGLMTFGVAQVYRLSHFSPERTLDGYIVLLVVTFGASMSCFFGFDARTRSE